MIISVFTLMHDVNNTVSDATLYDSQFVKSGRLYHLSNTAIGGTCFKRNRKVKLLFQNVAC